MSVLTLVRHAQASYMAEDYDRLSALGEQQAQKLGQFWAQHGIRFDKVYLGPARRHIRTMEIAASVVQEAGLPWPDPEIVPDLDEFDAYQVMKKVVPVILEKNSEIRRLHEEFRARQDTPEAGRLLQKLFEEVAREWCSGRYDIPDVESWGQFRMRVSQALDGIRTQAARSSNLVAFTSGGPIAATIAQALELPPEKAIEFVWLSRNCSYSEFLFSGDRFSVSSFNSFPHLDHRSLLTYR